MALFPTSPANGDQTVVNGITYTYNSAQTAWIRTSTTPPGDLNVSGNLTATGNISGVRLISNVATGTAPLTVSSTTVVANLNADLLDGYNTATANTANTVAVRNSDGNLAANFFIGNGSQLTGIITSVSNVSNGNSNLNIPAADGNINLSVAGNANVLVVTGTGVNVAGTLNATGNANVGNIGATQGVFTNVSGNGSSLSSITGANVTGTVSSATTSGTVTTAAQPNITSVGNLTSLVMTGNITPSATNTYSLGNSTNRWDNLWLAGNTIYLGNANIKANATSVIITNPDGGQFIVSGNGTASSSSIYNGNSNVNIPTANGNVNITAVGNTTLVVTGTGANVAGTLNVTGNANVSNIGATQGVFTNVSGNGSSLSSITGANVTGAVAFATTANAVAGANVSGTVSSATTAGTVTTAAQPNITSVGTLTSLGVTGNISSGNANLGNAATANFFIGSGNNLSNIQGANVTGTVASATTAGTVTTAAQPNITSVGTLTSLAVTGNATAGNIYANSGTIGASLLTGTLTTAAQPNITSVGTLTSLSVTGNVAAGNLTTTGVLSVTGTGVSSIAGNLDMTSNTIINLATPTASTDAATKQYVDDVAQGLNIHASCNAATQTTLASISGGTVTYNNGTAGVGATLTTTGSYTTIDGVTLSDGMRILVKNESTAANNGIYVRTSATVLTRATDFDTAAEIAGGDFTFVTAGTLYNSTGWVQIDEVTTVGTDPIVWEQFSGAGTYQAGTGLTLTGTTFSVNASQTQVTAVGTLTGLNSSGTITAPAFTANTGVFTGNGSGLTALTGANVTGTVSAATTAGTVTTAAQPNITSVGTLTSLGVTGNISAANVILGDVGVVTNGNASVIFSNTQIGISVNGASRLFVTGSGASVTGTLGVSQPVTSSRLISNIATGTAPLAVTSTTRVANLNVDYANVADNINVAAGTGNNFIVFANAATGNVAELTSTGLTANLSNNSITATTFVGALSGAATSATTAGTVTTAAQPNITSVGTLTSLAVTGNATAGNVYANSGTIGASLLTGTLTTAAQPNITSVGTLSTATITTGNITTINSGLLQNGNSNISITANGNITLSATGTPNEITITGTGVNVAGTLNANGNANVGNLGTAQVLATANVTAPQLISNVAAGTAPFVVTSNTVVPNLYVARANIADFISVAAGTGNNFLIFANAATGNISELTSTGLTANLSNNSITATTFVGALSGAATSATTAGTVTTAAQPNITSVGTLTSLGVSGNITAANITANTGVFTGNGSGLSAIAGANVTGTVANATTATTAGTVTTAAQPNITSVGTLTSASVTGNVTAGNVYANSGTIGASLLTGTLTTAAQPNITSVGTLTDLNVSGNAIVGGNLTVNGNLVYVNVDTLAVEDPIIQLQSGPNGAAPAANSGKDVGTALNYYDTAARVAFMGWDVSNVEFGLASQASITSEVVTFTSYGNLRVGNIIGNGQALTGLAGGNVTGQVSNALVAGTVYTAAQPNITSVGTLTSLGVTGNISSGNANLGNAATANFFIGSGNNLSNIQGANVTGAVATATTAGTVTTAAQPNITSVGTLTSLAVTANANVGNLNATTRIYGNDNLIVGSTGAEGGQIILGYAGVNNITGQANSTWNMDVDASNNFRLFTQNATGVVSGVSMTAYSANTNVAFAGNVSAPFFIGNGSQLTGITVAAGSSIVNGNSNVNIPAANGNVNISAVGTANVVVVTATGVNVAGTLNATGNANVGNLGVTGVVATTLGGTLTTAAQPNITSVGTLTSLAVTGNASAGNLNTAGAVVASTLTSNVATGTAPLTVTSTTRVANLNVNYANVADFISVAAGTGNNFLIFANAATGNITELTSTGLIANLSNNSITATTFVGALSGAATSATTAGTVTTAAQPNITSVGTLTSLGVSGTVTASAFTANTGVFTGNGSGLSAIAGANVTGTVPNATAATNASALLQNTSTATTVYPTFSTSSANGNSSAVINTGISANLGNSSITATTFVGALSGAATSATTAGTVTTAAQPNITSTGTLTSLTVTGNASAGNLNTAGAVVASTLTSNVATGTAPLVVTSTTVVPNLYVARANVADNITVAAGTGNNFIIFANAATGNISELTSTGLTANLSNNSITATTFVGALSGAATSATSATTAGTVTTAAQPNITSVGTLTSLAVSSNIGVNGANPGSFLASTGICVNGNIALNASGKIYFWGLNNSGAGFINNAGNAGVVTTAFGKFSGGGDIEYMRIDDTGNVGIGNTSPTHKLSVTGTLNASGNANVGNLGTAGLITATGNVSGGNLTTAGVLTVTGTGVSSIAGNLDMTSNTIINLATPTSASDAATKQYVDDVAQGLNIHPSCNAATTTTLATISGGTVTYNNGTAGVGATLTTTGSYTTIDGVTLSDGMRILVKNEATQANNGIYVRTSATVLTRATDFDTAVEIAGGDFTFITAGTLYNSTGWVQIDEVTTVGTDPIVWEQFSGAGTYQAGTGLTLTGTTFSVNASQTQVTAVGTLTGLNSSGTITAPAFTANTGVFTGNGSGLTALTGANVTGTVANATFATSAGTAGTVTTAAQPNITSVGTLTSLAVTGNASAGNLNTAGAVVASTLTSNVATGTAPLTVTSTTRVANLNVNYANVADFISVAAGTGNNFIIFANAATGNITELTSTGLIANLSNNSITATTFVGALSGAATSATTAGTVTTAAQPNITSVGTLTSLAITGNATAGNIGVNGNITAANITANTGIFTGNGSGLSAIAGANVTGTVANATFATSAGTAGTVTTAAQPNITSVGTLTSLGVNGTITGTRLISNIATGTAPLTVTSTTQVANLNVAQSGVTDTISVAAGTGNNFIVFASAATGNVNELTSTGLTANLSNNSITATTFVGALSGAATSATTAGTVTTAAQPNITSVGTLTGLTSSGAVSITNSTAATSRTTGALIVTGGIGANANSFFTNLNIASNIAYVSPNAANTINSTMLNGGTLAWSGNAGQLFSITDSMTGNIFTVNDVSGIPMISVDAGGNIQFAASGGFVSYGVTTGITAAGSTQGTATTLTRPINVVSTVSASTGVILPTVPAGARILVMNTSATALNVYPPSGAAINSAATNAAYAQPAGARLEFVSVSATQWYTLNATYG